MDKVDALIGKSLARSLARSGDAKRVRVEAGITLRELAEAVGTTAATISRWENGQRTPRGPQAVAWARALSALRAASQEGFAA